MIVLDSVNPNRDRITTIEFELPKFLVAQFNTHSMIRRNSASSRAVPTWRVIQQVMKDPYVPERFGEYGRGMSPQNYLSHRGHIRAKEEWLAARDSAVDSAISMAYGDNYEYALAAYREVEFGILGMPAEVEPIGAAKEIANRLLEPWMKTRIVATSTHWGSFIEQRSGNRNTGAQYELAKIADGLEEELSHSVPQRLDWDQWHTPYSDNLSESVAACAAVSYLNRNPSPTLTGRLLNAPHPSPFEHVARAMEGKFGAYTGWKSMRADFEDTGVFPAYNKYVY